MKLNLNHIDYVKEFVNIINKFNSDEVKIDLMFGRYLIDATSILGIFSLDLSKPVEIIINTENEDIKTKIQLIDKFIIK